MVKAYFKTGFRSLWRNRLFTTLNIFGLAIGISVCWMVYSIIRYEFSYDNSIPDKENISRIVSSYVFDDKESFNGGVSAPVYQGVRSTIPGILHTVPVFTKWVFAVHPQKTNGKADLIENPDGIVATDSAYFNMLPYQWLAGDKHTALAAPENVVLTESRMHEYFPGKKPAEVINQTITSYSRDTLQKTVTGVVADLQEPTEFTAKEFYVLKENAYKLAEWTNTNGSDKLYLQLLPNTNPEWVRTQIQALADQKWRTFSQSNKKPFNSTRKFELIPLKDCHFSTYVKERDVRKASKPVLYGLAGIGVFLLILACINYITMSVAQIPQRAKEIGVRKTLGGSRGALIGQFLMETFLTTLLAVGISFLLGRIGFRFLEDLIPPGLDPLANIWGLLLFILLLTITITLAAGLYPAWLITRVKTVNVFRNILSVSKNGRKFSLQKTLIVFQFIIALIFIIGAFIGGQQLRYTVKREMGFDKDAVVLIDIPWKYGSNELYKNRKFSLLNELKNITGIKNISIGTPPLSDGYSSSPYSYVQDGKEPVSRQLFKKWVDTAYIRLYDMQLLAGRNLTASDTTNELVLNETAVKAYGFSSPQEAIGKFLRQNDSPIPIVGVVKDFNMQSFYAQIDPAALMCDKRNIGTFNIKLDKDHSEQWQHILQSIEKKWSLFYPANSFKYSFYDETIAQLYKNEHNLAKLINLATAIAILISCLGLFGFATLTVFQRTKEIGIRKILGASVSGIVQLLSREYVWLVLIALLIASPIAWWVMNNWLESFAYRIEIQWWMFAAAGFAAIVIALVTVSFQAIKAATANPVKSLRTE